MKDVKSVFRRLQKNLMGARWFQDDWQIYNRGAYLQLYKSNWHIGYQGGVHFETFIEAREIKQKSFPVCLHAEEDCPSRDFFVKQLLELEGDRINSWKGYFIVGEGHSICQKSLPLNFKNLEERLFAELNHLRQLETAIDQLLLSLNDQETRL